LLNVSASVLSSKTTPEESEDEESKDEATDSLLECYVQWWLSDWDKNDEDRWQHKVDFDECLTRKTDKET
jgi:hypothetical protein